MSGDLTSGLGLCEAVKGVDTIIHCASSPKVPQATDIGGTRMLVQAARESGSPHFIYVSIVGTDHSPALYYRAKREAENHLLANNPSPFQRAVIVAALLGEPGQPILTPVQLQVGTNNPIDSSQGVCC